MKQSAPSATRALRLLACFCLLSAIALLPLAGCKKGKHTSDPRLQQIDDMLDAQLHPGTPRSRVVFYLNSQGFSEEVSADPHSLVAVVRHVDPDTLQPATARVTFHFNAGDQLLSYDLAQASGPLLQR